MGFETKEIVSLVVAALLAGILIPIGLAPLIDSGNYLISAFNATGVNESAVYFSTIAPSSIITLLGVVVPIIIVISVMMGFLRSK